MGQFMLIRHIPPAEVQANGATMRYYGALQASREEDAIQDFCERFKIDVGDISSDWAQECKKYSIVKLCLDPKIKPALFYEYEWYICSNFAPFEVKWRGVIWKTAEHAYQAAKFRFEDKDIADKIKNARSAHDAYKLATVVHKDKVRGDWPSIKLQIMEEIVRAKLSQHYYVQKKLLETGDRIIVEDSYRDDFWGWGANKDGANHLGKIWMKLRDELRAGMIPLPEDA